MMLDSERVFIVKCSCRPRIYDTLIIFVHNSNSSGKSAKYTNLDTHSTFQPVAIETLGPINDSARDFLSNLGRKISLQSSDDREAGFLFQ